MKKRTLVGLGVGLAGAVTAAAASRQLPRWRRAREIVAPELLSPVLFVPMSITNQRTVRFLRALPMPDRVPGGVRHDVINVEVAGRDPVTIHTYESPDRVRPSGALVWTHGGGFVLGTPAVGHEFCSRVAAELGAFVVSVDYRLAPEHPFPVPLEDAYTGLRWLSEHASELGVDPARLAVGGDSAGGGLAASLAQLAHDHAEVPVCFQLLVYPMLDDRTTLRVDHGGTGDFVWTPSSNRFGWACYLGQPPVAPSAPSYAAAARREDLSGLPQAWIGVGDLDLFHTEDVEYADRLRRAGVESELVVVPGMYHGADAIQPASELAHHGDVQSVQARRPACSDRLIRHGSQVKSDPPSTLMFAPVM